MKILVLSDIHANLQALEAVLEYERTYDFLLFAGDIVDYGISPSETVEWLRSVPEDKKAIVQGNHDLHAVKIRKSEDYNHMPPELYKWIHYDLQRMTAEQVEYLERLPECAAMEADGWTYLITHSLEGGYGIIESRCRFEQFWREHVPQRLRNASKRRIVFGHTHRQCIHILDEGMEWLNPGSVSYRRPDDPDKTAHYAVVQDGTVLLRHIPYNREPQKKEALKLWMGKGMMKTEVQDFMFFFGDAPTSRSELPERPKKEDSAESRRQ